MKKNFENIQSLISYSEGGVFSKVLSKSEHGNLTLFCMAAGSEISDHTSTKEGIVYVIEGKGIFRMAGKNIEMVPGVIINLKKNIIHSLKALGNTSFLLSLSD